MQLPEDVLYEIILHLDAVSTVRFLSSSTHLWNTIDTFSDRFTPYKKNIKYQQWNLGLFESIRRSNFPQIVFFLDKGADNVFTAVEEATLVGNIDIVKYLLGLDVCAKFSLAMENAAKKGHKHIIECMLPIYGSETYLSGALSQAIRNGYEDIVNLLMPVFKKEIHANWSKPVQAAVYRRRFDLVEFLESDYDLAKIIGAAEGGHLDLLEKYWENDLDPTSKRQTVYRAIDEGHFDVVTWILERAENDIVCSILWDHCMFSAARRGRRDMIEFFISKGATHWDMGLSGAMEGGHSELYEFFLSKGEDCQDWSWSLTQAAFAGNLNMIKIFMDKGTVITKDILEQACRHDHREVIEYLVDLLPDLKTDDWNELLGKVTMAGHWGLVEFCFKKGATDELGAMQKAAYHGYRNMLCYFIDVRGMDPKKVILQSVESNGYHKNVTQFLQKKYNVGPEFLDLSDDIE